MKLIIALLLFSLNTQAKEIELYYGSIVSHMMDTENFDYANKRSDNLIEPDFYGVSLNETNETYLKKYRVFMGEQSAGGSMFGATYTVGRRVGIADFGMAFGGYFQDLQSFKERNIKPFGLDLNESVGFVPIAAFELGARQRITPEIGVRFNFAYTVVLTQFTVSLYFKVD